MKRILIAEDEPSILLSLEFLLREAGYEVFTAQNGAEALEFTEQYRPDLVVLDVMLPIIDGFQVCRSLRADPALGDVRVLMLTARGREQEIARGLAAGANAYITKPFGTRELMKSIADLLGQDG